MDLHNVSYLVVFCQRIISSSFSPRGSPRLLPPSSIDSLKLSLTYHVRAKGLCMTDTELGWLQTRAYDDIILIVQQNKSTIKMMSSCALATDSRAVRSLFVA